MKANLAQREPQILARWQQLRLYERLMERRKDAPLYVLHDGPPYANGKAHIGHALNRILKDFVVRSRSMMGLRTPFVPGWDCHGMPIEHQVTRDLGPRSRTMSKLEIRKLCRKHAEKFIESQREDFRRLGTIADWDHPYLTFAPEYDSAEIGVLRQLVEHGYVYRGLRPVLWCAECRTALAEAEVEYHDHKSPSIYVAFQLNEAVVDAASLAQNPADGPAVAKAHRERKLNALIWTTTPWTIPANLGISLNAGFDYVALETGNGLYIVAARLAEAVEKECTLKVSRRIPLSREGLKALDGKDVFRHPLLDRNGRLMFADHVTLDAGTGLVHTAPGHGYEDFITGSAYGLEPLTPVDDGGVFTSAAGKYAGKDVFAANDEIVADLRSAGALIHSESVVHSYPHCWRSKNPLIFRATEQWFLRVDHEGLRQRLLQQIDEVQWVPKWTHDRIYNMVESRPDWGLSRQRAWGVPIPALKCDKCGEVFLDGGVLKRVEEIFANEGSDAWYSRPVSDFASDVKCPKCGSGKFTRQEDILDVWFDSGCSQQAVLARRPELHWPADAYVEAFEQTRGWFQSSLIEATATRGRSPYRSVISHGLTLDELGRKMSKSVGNTEDAADAIKRLGADVVRLIFSSVDYASDMNVGDTLFGAVAESYRKIRNTCRFILGNLSDFDPRKNSIEYSALQEFDRYLLLRTERMKTEVRNAYERYDFQAAYHHLLNFAVVDLSSLYIDVARDRLYCSKADSPERRSSQTALYLTIDAYVRLLSPLLPFTTDETYSHFPGERVESIHLLEFAPVRPEWNDAALAASWEKLLEIRSEALKLLEDMRKAGVIGAPLEARIRIAQLDEKDGDLRLSEQRKTLQDLFIVSSVQPLLDAEAAKTVARDGASDVGRFVRKADETGVVLVGERAPGRKCQRCWMYYDSGGTEELDARCAEVLGVTA